jgi:hypothetical protein
MPPKPPTGNQQQHVEKPRKVLAEQYDPAASPLQESVCVCTTGYWRDGRPHVHAGAVTPELHAGDWIVHEAVQISTVSPVSVMSDADFQALFN